MKGLTSAKWPHSEICSPLLTLAVASRGWGCVGRPQRPWGSVGPEPLHPFLLASFAGSAWHEGLPGSSGPYCKYLWFPGPLEKLSTPFCCLCIQETGRGRERGVLWRLAPPTIESPGTGPLHPALPLALLRGGPQGHPLVSLSPSPRCPAPWT